MCLESGDFTVMGLTVNFSKWGLMTVLELVLNARMLAESKWGQSPIV